MKDHLPLSNISARVSVGEPMSVLAKVERQLAQARAINPQLNALISLREQDAIRQARALDESRVPKETRGPLHGMTFSIKDNIDIAGEATTCGASFLATSIAPEDAAVVTRLRQAGAVILGKANMGELAFSARSHSPIGGQCRNAWNPERIPGGSSGGSAVSVATDMCDASIGTDTGGSIKIPAALNGVSALRSTVGRISNRGVLPMNPMSDTVGPIARSVDTLARIYQVLAGYDPACELSIERGVEDIGNALSTDVRGIRIGVPMRYFFDDVDPDIHRAVMQAAHTLRDAGAKLVDIDVPMAEEASTHQLRLSLAAICSLYRTQMEATPALISSSVLERMRPGLHVSGMQCIESIRFAQAFKRALRPVFGQVDAIISPAVRRTPAHIDDGASLTNVTGATTLNAYPGALAGLPSLVVPCGLTSDQLPIGLQLEAAWWNEVTLLRIGAAFQRHTGFHLQQPAWLPSARCAR